MSRQSIKVGSKEQNANSLIQALLKGKFPLTLYITNNTPFRRVVPVVHVWIEPLAEKPVSFNNPDQLVRFATDADALHRLANAKKKAAEVDADAIFVVSTSAAPAPAPVVPPVVPPVDNTDADSDAKKGPEDDADAAGSGDQNDTENKGTEAK